ncbi:S-locus cysteine-rich protein (SCR) [Zostera marina]|uniref:S-locus cysteine-rich protein (SCR) n=1 Tax=Zostera marina TaxID=29655 RepID=A0A0K9NPA0_ZOSMR|nr:S-locus cysteine-rich protein (SCR) [Zostera marina]
MTRRMMVVLIISCLIMAATTTFTEARDPTDHMNVRTKSCHNFYHFKSDCTKAKCDAFCKRRSPGTRGGECQQKNNLPLHCHCYC